MAEFSDYLEARTAGSDPDGTELLGVSQGGAARSLTVQQVANRAGTNDTTREFNRAFSAELLFDKNEVEYAEHTLTGDLEYTVATSGHLSNQFSSAVQRVVTDGTRTVTFTGFNFVLGDIQSGSMPDAGTYLVLFLYWNGIATVNWTKPSLEVANLTPLAALSDFAADPDATSGDSEIDLTWTNNALASSYEIQYSVTGGGGPWIALTTPAAGASSYSHTGLSAGTTYHYRIRAIGDQTAYSNSQWTVDAATTEEPSDVTAPTFTFSPADTETDVPMNGVVTITCSEPIQDADGVTMITDSNITDYLLVTEDDALGATIPYTATIDITKTIITITPNVVWPALGDVFIQISGVEDINNNESVTDDATFTCNDYTLMNGNYLRLGTQFDAIVTGDDIDFEIEYEFKDAVFSGDRGIIQKSGTTTDFSFLLISSGNNVVFKWFAPAPTYNGRREIHWTGALTGVVTAKIRLEYFGTIDTNNGLDRADLYLDDVLVGSKSLVTSGAATWPFGIPAGAAQLVIAGPTLREVRNAFIRSNSGATVEGSYPVIRTGLDTSGNARHGTWA